jgi:hypothetical protein
LSVLCFVATSAAAPSAIALQTIPLNEWSLTRIETRIGLQYGDNLDFGRGALNNVSETARTNGALSFEPALVFEWPAFSGTLFGKASAVAAANLLAGELSGQFARGGDCRIDTDEAHIGWRCSEP